MTTTSVTQTGAQFRILWELDTPEDVELRRTEPNDPDELLAVLDELVESYIDVRDDLDPGDEVEWTLTGVTSATVWTISTTAADATIPELDSDRRKLAALIAGARLHKRRDSPLGVAGGGDFGAIRVGFKDPDVEMLLRGLRRSVSELTDQTWPTVDELRSYLKAPSSITDAEIQLSLDAAIDIITDKCTTSGRSGLA